MVKGSCRLQLHSDVIAQVRIIYQLHNSQESFQCNGTLLARHNSAQAATMRP